MKATPSLAAAVFHSAEHKHVPEGALWTAVICQAIKEHKRCPQFFASSHFQWCCDMAGINPEFVREVMAKLAVEK